MTLDYVITSSPRRMSSINVTPDFLCHISQVSLELRSSLLAETKPPHPLFPRDHWGLKRKGRGVGREGKGAGREDCSDQRAMTADPKCIFGWRIQGPPRDVNSGRS